MDLVVQLRAQTETLINVAIKVVTTAVNLVQAAPAQVQAFTMPVQVVNATAKAVVDGNLVAPAQAAQVVSIAALVLHTVPLAEHQVVLAGLVRPVEPLAVLVVGHHSFQQWVIQPPEKKHRPAAVKKKKNMKCVAVVSKKTRRIAKLV